MIRGKDLLSVNILIILEMVFLYPVMKTLFITWEIGKKMNLGLELNLWNSLELQVDYFTEHRSNILQERAYIPTTMGLQATPQAMSVRQKEEV